MKTKLYHEIYREDRLSFVGYGKAWRGCLLMGVCDTGATQRRLESTFHDTKTSQACRTQCVKTCVFQCGLQWKGSCRSKVARNQTQSWAADRCVGFLLQRSGSAARGVATSPTSLDRRAGSGEGTNLWMVAWDATAVVPCLHRTKVRLAHPPPIPSLVDSQRAEDKSSLSAIIEHSAGNR